MNNLESYLRTEIGMKSNTGQIDYKKFIGYTHKIIKGEIHV